MKATIVTPDQQQSKITLTKLILSVTDPIVLQRLESMGILVLALAIYAYTQSSWWFFCVLLLVPDVSMLAYLHSKRVGTAVYNIFHSYLTPLSLGLVMIYFSQWFAAELALIWVSHIALDRCFGYGLKYPTNFKHIHLAWK